jgi:hypothetical protein
MNEKEKDNGRTKKRALIQISFLERPHDIFVLMLTNIFHRQKSTFSKIISCNYNLLTFMHINKQNLMNYDCKTLIASGCIHFN